MGSGRKRGGGGGRREATARLLQAASCPHPASGRHTVWWVLLRRAPASVPIMRCLGVKVITLGVSRLLSLFSSTSTPAGASPGGEQQAGSRSGGRAGAAAAAHHSERRPVVCPLDKHCKRGLSRPSAARRGRAGASAPIMRLPRPVLTALARQRNAAGGIANINASRAGRHIPPPPVCQRRWELASLAVLALSGERGLATIVVYSAEAERARTLAGRPPPPGGQPATARRLRRSTALVGGCVSAAALGLRLVGRTSRQCF